MRISEEMGEVIYFLNIFFEKKNDFSKKIIIFLKCTKNIKFEKKCVLMPP
jgi:hypothetical protein